MEKKKKNEFKEAEEFKKKGDLTEKIDEEEEALLLGQGVSKLGNIFKNRVFKNFKNLKKDEGAN